MSEIYRLLRREDWESAQALGHFAGSADDLRSGFIHFSSEVQVAETARKHYAGLADLVLLQVDLDALARTSQAQLKWEVSRAGQLFPHLYGELPVAAVTRASDFAAGTFSANAEVGTLVGALDSPFVRRVAITLQLAGLQYTHLPLRTVADAEAFAKISPLKRAPTLVLPDQSPLFDSQIILSHLSDQFAGVAALSPREPASRMLAYQVLGAALGLADKAVSALYEGMFHPPEHRNPSLLTRLRGQLTDTLSWLESRAPRTGFLCGAMLTHADIAVGTAARFALDAHPAWVDLTAYPSLYAWWLRLEALSVFERTYTRFTPSLD